MDILSRQASRAVMETRATRNRITIKTKPVVQTPAAGVSQPGAPIRALVVAGPSMHTKLVRMVLANHGCSVSAVSDAGASDAALAVEAPEVVVLDWDTDGIDGHAVLRGLRSNPETRRVPVILLTNRAVSEGWRRELAGFGVHWILEKPIVALSLPKLIERTIKSVSQGHADSSSPAQYQRSALLVECGQTASGVMWKAVW